MECSFCSFSQYLLRKRKNYFQAIFQKFIGNHKLPATSEQLPETKNTSGVSLLLTKYLGKLSTKQIIGKFFFNNRFIIHRGNGLTDSNPMLTGNVF